MSVPARRKQVAYAKQRGLSERRACTPLSVARSSLHYESAQTVKDVPVLTGMAILSAQYPRYGYRRIQIFLERQGHKMSAGRAYRLWSKAGLQVPRKRPRRRIASGRPRPQAPMVANQVWAYDFVFDTTASGQQLKCLTVIDEYTRESLAIDVAGSIRSTRVIEVLSQLISVRGVPKILRSDNGPEFVSKAGAGIFCSGNFSACRIADGRDGLFPRLSRHSEITSKPTHPLRPINASATGPTRHR